MFRCFEEDKEKEIEIKPADNENSNEKKDWIEAWLKQSVPCIHETVQEKAGHWYQTHTLVQQPEDKDEKPKSNTHRKVQHEPKKFLKPDRKDQYKATDNSLIVHDPFRNFGPLKSPVSDVQAALQSIHEKVKEIIPERKQSSSTADETKTAQHKLLDINFSLWPFQCGNERK